MSLFKNNHNTFTLDLEFVEIAAPACLIPRKALWSAALSGDEPPCQHVLSILSSHDSEHLVSMQHEVSLCDPDDIPLLQGSEHKRLPKGLNTSC